MTHTPQTRIDKAPVADRDEPSQSPRNRSASDGAASDPLALLLAVLQLSPDPANPDSPRLRGRSLSQPNGRVYGGQVLAQALLAAGRTVPDGRLPHSMHGYFLRAGEYDADIEFAVEEMRDGRSFSARRTHAIQHGQPILSMIASFQEAQPGLELSKPMPDVPGPDGVPSALDVMGDIDNPVARFWSHHAAFELRHVGGSLYLGSAKEVSPTQSVWMRARGKLDDDQLLHRALMAYACDQVMLEPVLRASGHSWVTPGMSVASLDHAMWWHRDARADEWLLYTGSAASAQGGRGLGTAQVFTEDGTLVASIAQEGMIRIPEA